MLPNDDFKKGQVYPIFPAYFQPTPYKGTFDIGGATGHLSRDVPALSVEEGFVDSVINATPGATGPFCKMGSFRARGTMTMDSVYGFYIIYGLARWMKLPYPSFGHAKLFPEQPKTECSLKRMTLSHKIIRASVEITIKLAEEINVDYYRPQRSVPGGGD